MIIERDHKITAMEQQLSAQLSQIMQQIDPRPVKTADRSNGTTFVSVEDALKELIALGEI
jgi:hypothetical protein